MPAQVDGHDPVAPAEVLSLWREECAITCPPMHEDEGWIPRPPVLISQRWELERSIDEIVTTSLVPPPDGRLVVGPATTPALAARMRGMGSPLAAGGGWEVFGTGACAPAQPLAGAP